MWPPQSEHPLILHEFGTWMIMGVEQTMCLVAVGGILEVLFVDRGDLFVVGCGAELEVRVVTIEAACTHRDDFVGHEHVRLTSAIDAAARASHDFDDMIFLLAFANHLADFVDVGKAKDLAEIELDAGDFDFGFADAFGTTEGFEIEVFGFLAGEFFGGETNDGFGDTTGCTVDNASAGFETHRIVAGFVGQAVEVNAEFANEVGQFCGRHRDIDVADAVAAEFFAGTSNFLSVQGMTETMKMFLLFLPIFSGSTDDDMNFRIQPSYYYVFTRVLIKNKD